MDDPDSPFLYRMQIQCSSLIRAWEIETHDSVVTLAEDFGREAAEFFSQFTLFFVKFYTFLSTLENILRHFEVGIITDAF